MSEKAPMPAKKTKAELDAKKAETTAALKRELAGGGGAVVEPIAEKVVEATLESEGKSEVVVDPKKMSFKQFGDVLNEMTERIQKITHSISLPDSGPSSFEHLYKILEGTPAADLKDLVENFRKHGGDATGVFGERFGGVVNALAEKEEATKPTKSNIEGMLKRIEALERGKAPHSEGSSKIEDEEEEDPWGLDGFEEDPEMETSLELEKWKKETNAKGLDSLPESEIQRLLEQNHAERKQLEEKLMQVRPLPHESMTSYNEEHITPEGNEAIAKMAEQAETKLSEGVVKRTPEHLRDTIIRVGEWYSKLGWKAKLGIGIPIAALGVAGGLVGSGAMITSAAVLGFGARTLGAAAMFATIDKLMDKQLPLDAKWRNAKRFTAATAGALTIGWVLSHFGSQIGHYATEWGITEKLTSALHHLYPTEGSATSSFLAGVAGHEFATDMEARVNAADAKMRLGTLHDMVMTESTPSHSSVDIPKAVPLGEIGGVETHPPAAHAPESVGSSTPHPRESVYVVNRGDNSYTVLRQLGGIDRLSEAQKTNAFENFLASKEFKDLDLDIDAIKSGDVVDVQELQDAFNAAQVKGEGLVAHAQGLGGATLQAIDTNNARIAQGGAMPTGTSTHGVPHVGGSQPHAIGDQGNPLPEHKPAKAAFGGHTGYETPEATAAPVQLHPESISTVMSHEHIDPIISHDSFANVSSHVVVGNEASPNDVAWNNLRGYVGKLVDQTFKDDFASNLSQGARAQLETEFRRDILGLNITDVGGRQYGVATPDIAPGSKYVPGKTVEQVLQDTQRWLSKVRQLGVKI